MNTMTNFRDSFYMSTGDYNELVNEVHSLENTTSWIDGVKSNEISISSVVPDDITGSETDIVNDTMKNTGIMIEFNGKRYCLRDTAVTSLLSTANISGSALGRLSAAKLAEVVNTCMSVSKGNSLMLYRGGKISACLSENYKVMPIAVLLKATTKTLRDRFGAIRFCEGEITHAVTTALWELPDAQSDLLDVYNDSVEKHKRQLHGRTFMPAVRFITSDVGKCAATLIPVFKMSNGACIRINSGIKVAHKGSGGIDAYMKAIDLIYAKFKDMGKTISAMSRCCIDHPLNALVGMCKKAGIPKKYASIAYDEIEMFAGTGSCYMDDIYLSIASITAAAQRSGLTKNRILDLEESIAKILSFDWDSFDVSGTVSW